MRPVGHLVPQSWMQQAAVQAVLQAIGAGGGTIRFVGGCVRDAVLGRAVLDKDLACDLSPEQSQAALEAAGLKVVPTGIDHGTVTAVSDGMGFEITTLRRDLETDGRRAVVAFTDNWVEDAARRDLTMNALYLDGDGTLYDPVGGFQDLLTGRIRFVGQAQQRLEEDVLRLLRFFRFYAHYGRVSPDSQGLAACRDMAPRLPSLSKERLRQEMVKLLKAPDPLPALFLMDLYGVSKHLLPDYRGLATVTQVVRAEQALGLREPMRRLQALTAMSAKELAGHFRLSNKELETLQRLEQPLATLEGDLEQILYRQGPAKVEDALVALAPAEAGALLRQVRAYKRPTFPVTGKDLLALGVPAGPALGQQLRALEERWIASGFRLSRAELLGD